MGGSKKVSIFDVLWRGANGTLSWSVARYDESHMARRHNVHPEHPENPKPSKGLIDAVSALEAARSSRILLLIEGTMMFRRQISECTYADVRRALANTHLDKLDLLIASNGGLPDEAYKITRLLQTRSAHFSVLVPEHAKSAATLICLGAREIVMTRDAELGPIDMQIHDSREPNGWISALQEFKGLEAISSFCHMFLDGTSTLIENISGRSMSDSIETASAFVSPLLRPLFEQVDPRKLGGYTRALEVMERYGERLLGAAGYDREDCRRIVHRLVYHYPSHGFVIHVDEAARMGLRAVPAPNETMEHLMDAILDEAPEEGFVGFPKPPAAKAAMKGTRRAKKANGVATNVVQPASKKVKKGNANGRGTHPVS